MSPDHFRDHVEWCASEDVLRRHRHGRLPATRDQRLDETEIDHLRDDLLAREIVYTLTEAQIWIERWRRQYNTVQPHSALGYRPPATEAISPVPLSGLPRSPALS